MIVMNFDDLVLAFHFVNSGALTENQAFISKDSGKIYWYSELGTIEDELPDDIESGNYVEIPHRNELDLGNRLVLRFIEDTLPDDFDAVADMFRRPRAYARFKDLLDHRGKLEDWYQFEERKYEEALREWCRDHEIDADG